VIAETEYGPVPERKQGLDINNDSGLEFENSRSSNDTNSEAVRSAARPAFLNQNNLQRREGPEDHAKMSFR
jgi:hypothetical protein